MESMRWVGVDVHAKGSVAAELDQTTGEVSTHRIRVDLTRSWTGWHGDPAFSRGV